jgi:hypothetical protein
MRYQSTHLRERLEKSMTEQEQWRYKEQVQHKCVALAGEQPFSETQTLT